MTLRTLRGKDAVEFISFAKHAMLILVLLPNLGKTKEGILF